MAPHAELHVCFVCTGNICRSPIAEKVLVDELQKAGLAERVRVTSAGTGGWHVGGPPVHRAAALLTTHGYDASRHVAQQFGPAWFAETDLVLAMDADNYSDIVAQGPGASVRMFRDFDPRAGEHDRDVPDPYFGGDEGFAEVLAMVERTADALVAALVAALDEALRPVDSAAVESGD